MIHPKCIIPECHADTFFVEIMKDLSPRSPNHQHSKGEVLKTLAKIDVQKALGIIDKDPHSKTQTDLSKYDYELIDDDGNEGYLKLYRHANGKYFLIEINKEFEYWLYHKVVKEAAIQLADYDIPEDWKEFGNYFKGPTVRTKGKVYQFFKALKNSNSSSLQLYRSWVEEYTN